MDASIRSLLASAEKHTGNLQILTWFSFEAKNDQTKSVLLIPIFAYNELSEILYTFDWITLYWSDIVTL